MSTRDDVLAALRAAGARGVSGEDIGRDLGVSRVAVGKHVAALRERGYTIDAVHGSGYVFRAAPDHVLPEEVAAHLRDAMWHRIEGGLATGSTNDDAKELARGGAGEGAVVVAAEQTGGRGRFDRAWHSPAGGAYVSAVVVPPVSPSEVGPLPLVAAVGVAQGLSVLGVDATLKWPNDLYVGDRKLAGILVELSADSDRVLWVVVGFGLNVNRPVDAPDNAVYVSDLRPGLSASHVAAAALDGLATAYRAWLAAGFAPLADAYRARAYLHGRDVVVRDAAGAVRTAGVAEGIDDLGRLLVRCGSDVVPVVAGEVTLRHE
ncbi:MAG: biotin--[acetyl-CoA-carboxylase] ligase [Actinobacteria bacterium]|nr:MAG: biotin--[acetyl-CoA-carboxylase] ligase [Actinomycetota bacterium]